MLMKKLVFLVFSLAILFSCSNDNGGVQTPAPALPTADFSASKTNVQTGSTISFSDESQHANTYTWTFEGGNPTVSSSKNQDVIYDTAGTYNVTLKVTNNDGEDTETKTDYITVTQISQAPMAEFTESETMLTTGGQITFTDESINSPTTWAWEFEGGDPVTSTEQNPTVTYTNSGTFGVILTVTNDTGSSLKSKIDYITITEPAEKPEADFTASETTITSGNDITFTDTSINNPTSWEWEFEGGNPATSADQNPVISYNNSGTYEVKLTATNSGGSDEELKSGFITVNQQTASYTVTFQGNWSAATHQTDFPTGADHFSGLIGMVHKVEATIFKEGELATSGIEDMAETGNNGDLQDEIDALVNSGLALNRVNGSGLGGGTEMTSVTIDVTEEFSLVTLVSMIAPSPDWFVAAENVALFQNGEFLENVTFNGISYDSGTDSGSSFNSGDDDTNPAENILLIADAPLGNGTTIDPTMAIFTFTKN